MNQEQAREIELLIRKNALKDVELYIVKQVAEIDEMLNQIKEEKNG